MELSNTESIAGKEVVETLGLVRGNTVRARNVGRDITQGLRNLAGGELKGYTELMTDARDQAQDRMIEEAEALGADGVINVRFTTSSIADSGAGSSRTGPRCGCGSPAASPPRLVLPVLLAEHVRDLLDRPVRLHGVDDVGITFSDPARPRAATRGRRRPRRCRGRLSPLRGARADSAPVRGRPLRGPSPAPRPLRIC